MNAERECGEVSSVQVDSAVSTSEQPIDVQPSSPNSSVPSSTTTAEVRKPCVVCGDRGNGYHYGAYACEGCKAFFKRYLVKKSKYTCKTHDTCEITKQTRNQCPACRLKKCLVAGMYKEGLASAGNVGERLSPRKPDLIQPKVEALSPPTKCEPPEIPAPDYIDDLIASAVNADPFKAPQITINPEIISALQKETCRPGSVSSSVNSPDMSSGSPSSTHTDPAPTITDQQELPAGLPSGFPAGLPSGFPAGLPSGFPACFSPHGFSPPGSSPPDIDPPDMGPPDMSPPDMAAGKVIIPDIASMTASMATEIMPGMDPALLMEGGEPSPMFVFLQAYAELFEIISWARKLEGFQTLEMTDRIKLLRNSFMSVNILRLTIRTVGCPPGFVCVTKGVQMPAALMAKMGFKPELMLLTAQSAKIFGQAELDDTEYCLLNAVMLFTPDCDEEAFSNAVYDLREKYLSALNWYMYKRTPETALHRYSLLLMEMQNIKTASFIAQNMFMSMVKNGQAHMNDLVTELFHCKFGNMNLQ